MQPTDEHRGAPPGRHADAGELHALLDGALDVLDGPRAREVRDHARACRACRDRLAVEAAVRDRSRELLEADDPLAGLALPSLAALRHRAGRGARVGGFSRRGLGWVATVALSLGVGWGIGAFGPAGWRPGASPAVEPTPPSGDRVGAEIPAAEPDGSNAVGPGAGASEGAGAAAPGAAEPAPPDDPGTVAVDPGRPGEAARSTPSAVAARSTPSAVAAPSTPAEPPTPRGATADPVVVAEAIAPAADTVDRAPAAVPDPSAVGAAVPTESEVLARLDLAVAAAPSSAVRRAVDSLDVAQRARRGLSDPRVPAVSFPQTAPARGGVALPRAPTAFGDGRDEGGAGEARWALVLPGLELEEIRAAEVWPGQQGVVVRQRLPDGREVELRAAGSPVGADAPPSAPPPARAQAPSGWARAVRAVDGGWLVLDGPLTAEALEALLATAG